MNNLIWIIIVVLLIAWITGAFVMKVGSLIHVLIVIAVILLIYRLVTGRKVL